MRSFSSPPLRRVLVGLAAVAVSLLTFGDAYAQRTSAALAVRVMSASTGQPLSGAIVQIDGVGFVGTTDEAGRLRVDRLPLGDREVTVRYLGYASDQQTVQLDGGQTSFLPFTLRVQPIELAEVRVQVRPSILKIRGFYDRQGGGGTFLTREDIEELSPRFLSDVLRQVPGARLSPTRAGARVSFRGALGAGRCPVQFFIDGVPAYAFRADDMLPHDVAGLEIYRGAATIPPQFRVGTAGCGVIVIWTRIE